VIRIVKRSLAMAGWSLRRTIAKAFGLVVLHIWEPQV